MVLGYLIGMMEIADMRAAYEKKFGKPATPKVFVDKLLRIGSLPPSLVRAELLGEPLPVTQRRARWPRRRSGPQRGCRVGDPARGRGTVAIRVARAPDRRRDEARRALRFQRRPIRATVAQSRRAVHLASRAGARRHVHHREREDSSLAEVGLVVNPTAASPVASSPNRPHELAVARQSDRLVLTFGSGTVQKFQRVGPASGRIVPLSKGALALVDGHFILVFEEGARALAGSGKYTQQETRLQLMPERWLSANGSQVRYARARVDATLDATTLTIPGEGAIQVAGQRR